MRLVRVLCRLWYTPHVIGKASRWIVKFNFFCPQANIRLLFTQYQPVQQLYRAALLAIGSFVLTVIDGNDGTRYVGGGVVETASVRFRGAT
jgi:hypothetical protein